MNAVVGDDALDTPQTDGEVGLTQLLGDDFGRGLRVQKAVAQDLADGLVGAAVIGFGAGLVGTKGGEAALLEVLQDLIIALAAVAVFLGDGADVILQTLAFDEHEETVGLEIGGWDRQSADGAGETMGFRI